jgi:hypothetical protein
MVTVPGADESGAGYFRFRFELISNVNTAGCFWCLYEAILNRPHNLLNFDAFPISMVPMGSSPPVAR